MGCVGGFQAAVAAYHVSVALVFQRHICNALSEVQPPNFCQIFHVQARHPQHNCDGLITWGPEDTVSRNVVSGLDQDVC